MALDCLLQTLRSERLQFLIFVGISLVVAALLGALNFYGNPPLLLKLFGDVNPLIGVFLVALLGFFLFTFLLSRGWFAVYRNGNLVDYLYASGLAALFGLTAIIVDYSTRLYAADINVLFPKSLLFYPAIGYVA